MPLIYELFHPNRQAYTVEQWHDLRVRLFHLLGEDTTVREYVLSRPPAPGRVLFVMEDRFTLSREQLGRLRGCLFWVVAVPHHVRVVEDGVVINGRAVPRELVGEEGSDDGSSWAHMPEEYEEEGVLPT
ncbi:uncharacterized protein LOC62_06G007866 [Vanrija pseudolonga]|uniref:Uncharacterized protein n=1 Tax=Vanrija pseudolonga TaxID=143232 RepID=A0AAF0YGT5_9TREE|nr:hypothetical protein LOC62_06G007866 [Vanrija pseudolonga]